ncbi:ATP-binding cassette domain-containing protein [Lichenibacterium ramalinae]|uniref:ATP-binding cassette domain-containing protein n=1 Tax=Lichenibacterium ramalinae TaxID=2316527 RepID=A0A4Q2RIB7_9HYPH|nr:ATP-binding cassette domain-containing protein [Lichenibacterium ramalinae]RYB06644.1 ATP-binding cassette domain-containing protein [Lichenibacterium ramalinae]
MTAPLLETRGLTMRFGGVVAVDAVDFTLEEGELRCLIGPNGAGKSTFFKVLTGQLLPSAGTVRYRGRDIAGAAPHAIARAGIGIKLQTPSVFNGLSIRENLWLAARRKNGAKRADAVVDGVLSLIALAGSTDRIVGTLAHGQRQWVEIGTVLAGEPDLILLDEPAAGMNHDEVGRTAEIVRAINRTTSLIVVEHDMAFIRMISDRITVFNRGSVLMEDRADAVMRDQRVRDVYLGKKAA